MRRPAGIVAALLGMAGAAAAAGAAEPKPTTPSPAPAPIRVGLVGLDSSHAVAFTSLFNDPARPDHVPGARVVAGFKGGSPDVEASATRIEKFTAELRDKWKIEIVGSIDELLRRVDAVIINSVDGRTHLAQARPVLAAKKRLFIDKPLAASYEDAREIHRLARASGTPFFSASSLRFQPELQALRDNPKLAPAPTGVFSWGPAPTEPHHPDLFWYGVHAVEILYALMGPGCVGVSRTHTAGADLVVGRWRDGRTGVVRGIRDGAKGYGAVAFGAGGVVPAETGKAGYRPMLVEIVKFFQTGKPPVAPEETLETMAFMQAADVSKSRGGAEVSLETMLARR